MNNVCNSCTSRQPYEIVETLEETITRYFDPDLSKSNFSVPYGHYEINTSQRKISCECPEPPERDRCGKNDFDQQMFLKNQKFKDLYERFLKLRSVMSELTAKFTEINLLKVKANQISPITSDGVSDLITTNDMKQQKLRENVEVLNGIEHTTSVDGTEQITGNTNCSNKAMSGHKHDENVQALHTDTEMSLIYANDRSCRYIYGNKCTERVEIDILKKSKNILINLIDKELEKTVSGNRESMPVSQNNSAQLKMGCLEKINDELSALKDLEGLDG